MLTKEFKVKAKQIAAKSQCNFQVSCIIFNKKGRIISHGYNHISNLTKRFGLRSVHAEMDALMRKGLKRTNDLEAFIYRKNGNPITPCNVCAKLLRNFGIKTVYCTYGENKILIMEI